MSIRLPIEAARKLLEAVMCGTGYTGEQAAIIVDHLIDSELRGLTQSRIFPAWKSAARMRFASCWNRMPRGLALWSRRLGCSRLIECQAVNIKP